MVEFRVPFSRLREFEVVEDGKPYREWIMPAAFISEFATIAPCPDSP
jgi:hypothetical protein